MGSVWAGLGWFTREKGGGRVSLISHVCQLVLLNAAANESIIELSLHLHSLQIRDKTEL